MSNPLSLVVPGPLKIDDVESLLPPAMSNCSEEVQKSIIHHQRLTCQFKINRINRRYDDLLDLWRGGSPVLFFIGLELCDGNIDTLFDRIRNPEFQTQVKREMRVRYQGIVTAQDSENDSSPQIEYKQAGASENESDDDRYAKKSTQHKLGVKFASKTEKGAKAKKNSKKNGDERIEFTGLTFIKGGSRFRVGAALNDTDFHPLNPIPGVLDPLTEQEMKRPAMSPDFYVLDYSTWMKYIYEKHENPYTRKHMVSKRDLIILTIDNFEQYKDKIRNLDLM